MGRLVLCGPQAPQPDLGAALADAGIPGPVALITAGWQERESDDQGLVAELRVEAVNLHLHRRSEEVFAADPELAAAHQARQTRLRQMHDFYRIRLEHASEAARAISVRGADPELAEEERRSSLERLRELDVDHLYRQKAVHDAFDERWRPGERPQIFRQRAELEKLIAPTRAVVVAGGHVASLLNRLRLFDIAGLVGDRPWLAAAAGAMVLCDRIYVFHDSPPYGTGVAELFEAGLGLVRDLVVLPDPRRRLRLDDREGIARFVQRAAPAACSALDRGARIFVEGGRVVRQHAHRLAKDGSVLTGWS